MPVEHVDVLPLPADLLRCTVVILENASKALPGRDGNDDIRGCRQRCDELVAETLVVPLCMLVHYVFGYRCPQVSLTERYNEVETLPARASNRGGNLRKEY